jgi:hypothetical protein
MANLVTSGWTAGANVSAYPGSALALSRGEAQAAGSAIETVAASAAGVATHTTLANDTGYVLQQAGAARTVRARIADSQTETGRATGTGTTTSGSASVTSVTATAGTIVVGQEILGAGIPRGSRVKSFSAGTVTMTEKATASATVPLDFTGAKNPRARVLRERDKRGTS